MLEIRQMVVWVFTFYPREGRLPNQSDKTRKEFTAGCEIIRVDDGDSGNSSLGAERLRKDGLSMGSGGKDSREKSKTDTG